MLLLNEVSLLRVLLRRLDPLLHVELVLKVLLLLVHLLLIHLHIELSPDLLILPLLLLLPSFLLSLLGLFVGQVLLQSSSLRLLLLELGLLHHRVLHFAHERLDPLLTLGHFLRSLLVLLLQPLVVLAHQLVLLVPLFVFLR